MTREIPFHIPYCVDGLLVPRMHGQYLSPPRGRLSSSLDVPHWIPKLGHGISPNEPSLQSRAQESLLKFQLAPNLIMTLRR